MKPRDRITNIREFEAFLRRNGFSRNEAKIISGSWGLLEKFTIKKVENGNIKKL